MILHFPMKYDTNSGNQAERSIQFLKYEYVAVQK